MSPPRADQPLALAAIKERCEKAAEGPWVVDPAALGVVLMPAVDNLAGFIIGRSAEFVAHARTDLPACVAEIEQLREQLRATKQELSAVHSEASEAARTYETY